MPPSTEAGKTPTICTNWVIGHNSFLTPNVANGLTLSGGIRPSSQKPVDFYSTGALIHPSQKRPRTAGAWWWWQDCHAASNAGNSATCRAAERGQQRQDGNSSAPPRPKRTMVAVGLLCRKIYQQPYGISRCSKQEPGDGTKKKSRYQCGRAL